MSFDLKRKIARWVMFSGFASLAPLLPYCLAYLVPIGPPLTGKPFDIEEMLRRGDAFVIALTLLFAAGGDLFGAKQVRGFFGDLVVPLVVLIGLVAAGIGVFYVEYSHRISYAIPTEWLCISSGVCFILVLAIGSLCIVVCDK